MLESIYNWITGNKYVFAIFVFFGFYILSELFVLIVEKIILRLTRKTETHLDDMLVKKTSKPISVLLVFLGLKIAMTTLDFSDAITDYSNKILYSLMIIGITYIVVAVADTFLSFWGEKFAKKTKSTMDDHLIALGSKAVKAIGIILGFLFILNVWEIQIGPFLASLGIAGIAVAFALQSTLGNIFGGVSLILDKNVEVGEVVTLDATTKGTVMDIGLRSTKIKTFDNEIIIVPNGDLASKRIHNNTQPDPSARIIIPFGVAYGTDVDKVKKIVLKEIKKIEGQQKNKEPMVRFTEMADSALLFKAYFWMKEQKERFRAKDEANTLIYKALNKAKIEIPYPQMDVHLKKR